MLLSACRLMRFYRERGEDLSRANGHLARRGEFGILLIRCYAAVAIPFGNAPRSNQKSELFFVIDRALACIPNHERDSNGCKREDSNRPNRQSDSIHSQSSNETGTPKAPGL